MTITIPNWRDWFKRNPAADPKPASQDVHTLTPEQRASDGITLAPVMVGPEDATLGVIPHSAAADAPRFADGGIIGPNDSAYIVGDQFVRVHPKFMPAEVVARMEREFEGKLKAAFQNRSVQFNSLSDTTPQATPEGPAHAEESNMANKFVGLLQTIGKDFTKGLSYAVQYALPVEKLVGLLFPAAAPVANEVADATSLIQNAVILVEQKYAASGVQNGTGAQKSAEVLTLVSQTVTGLLTKAGLSVDSDYLQGLVSAVVAILNVQPAPKTPAAA